MTRIDEKMLRMRSDTPMAERASRSTRFFVQEGQQHSKEGRSRHTSSPFDLAAKSASAKKTKNTQQDSLTAIAPLPSMFIPSPSMLEEDCSVRPAWSLLCDATVEGVTRTMRNHVDETTIALSDERFADTPLQGVRIVIQEYSTAPRQFNVYFLCPTATSRDYLNKHMDSLIAHLTKEEREYAFHQIQTRYDEERPPLIRRKKQLAGGHDDPRESR